MKFFVVLLSGFSMLFLTAFQKYAETSSLREEPAVVGDKAGDLQIPTGVIESEEITGEENVFKKREEETDKDPAMATLERKMRLVIKDRGSYYQLSRSGIPLCFLDSTDLFIGVTMEVQKSSLSFSYEVDYALGQSISYSSGFSSPDDYEHNTGKSSDTVNEGDSVCILLTDRIFGFKINLEHTPGYNVARISLPFEMRWVKWMDIDQYCEMVLRPEKIKVEYLNE